MIIFSFILSSLLSSECPSLLKCPQAYEGQLYEDADAKTMSSVCLEASTTLKRCFGSRVFMLGIVLHALVKKRVEQHIRFCCPVSCEGPLQSTVECLLLTSGCHCLEMSRVCLCTLSASHLQ